MAATAKTTGTKTTAKPKAKPTKTATPRKRKAPQSALSKRAEALIKAGKKKIDELDLQPIWDKTKKEVQLAMKVLEKGTEKATKKTLALSQQANLQYQIYTAHHQLQKILVQVGGRLYDLDKAESTAVTIKDPATLKLLVQVRKLDEKIRSFKEKSAGIKKRG